MAGRIVRVCISMTNYIDDITCRREQHLENDGKISKCVNGANGSLNVWSGCALVCFGRDDKYYHQVWYWDLDMRQIVDRSMAMQRV